MSDPSRGADEVEGVRSNERGRRLGSWAAMAAIVATAVAVAVWGWGWGWGGLVGKGHDIGGGPTGGVSPSNRDLKDPARSL